MYKYYISICKECIFMYIDMYSLSMDKEYISMDKKYISIDK